MTLTDTNDTALAPLDFAVTKNLAAASPAAREEILANPGFGQKFTDHMVDICWSAGGGWHRPRVQPYGPISLDPAASVLHYGQEIFEGLKAYRWADGSIRTFRPDRNAARLRASARRLALPELPTEYFVQSLRELIAVDGDWVPSAPETSLYLRPFMFAKEAFLGVRAAKKVAYYVIASPAGAYFHGGIAPVKIWLETEFSRAGSGGLGAAKTGGNYAASLLPHEKAAAHGCAQELYLDAAEGRYIEELGGMNVVFVRRDGSLLVPESDSILPSITRDSVLTVARDLGHEAEIRQVAIEEWREGVDSGEIVEAFACGTAAVITPIGQLIGEEYTIGDPDAPAGALTMEIRQVLTDIQYGRREDTHGWMLRLDD
ncbi:MULTISPECIES: branched-chain amino acid aminotransferase [Microbacterium]|uniref:branched-chain-amino-acid transaminase n=1 Tax=Microbacterium ginsengisoli TaxID=400772 RepID=A0A1P8SD77_9MICO|nr:branched-chain amino acid aminotransferase [Microbacterium sp. 4NA327F11]APY18947.1 MgiTA2 [Microbacterium ginsengisoli]MCK9916889.1 branched-chain amino acid aminotransferase [Microbacteriaceae bacterium K1510]